jgi:hypothetical protein
LLGKKELTMSYFHVGRCRIKLDAAIDITRKERDLKILGGNECGLGSRRTEGREC